MSKPRIQVVLAVVAVVALFGCAVLVRTLRAQDDEGGKGAKGGAEKPAAAKGSGPGAAKGAAGGAAAGAPPGMTGGGAMPGGMGGGAGMPSGPGGGAGGAAAGAPPGMAGGGGGMPGGMGGGGGMPGGMGGGMGGGAAAGAPLTWSSNDMPPELVMDYSTFTAKTGTQPAPIPDIYLKDDKGQIAKRTVNEWDQLQRVYGKAREGEAEAEGRAGRPGGALYGGVAREIGVKMREMETMRSLTKGLDKNFYFEVGYPQVEHVTVGSTPPDADTPVGMSVDVVMRVRPSFQKSYADRVYAALKKFDNPGDGRSKFEVIDYKGGFYHPLNLTLSSEAIGVWSDFWGQNTVKFSLLDTTNKPVVEGTAPAGLTAGILSKLIHLDELVYQPRYDVLVPPKDFKFRGGRLNLNYSKGWYYRFHFSVPLGRMRTINAAKAELLLGPDKALTTAAAGGGGAPGGGMPGMPGGGGPGGMPGMPGGGGPGGMPGMPGGGGPGGAGGMPGMPGGGGMPGGMAPGR